MRVRIPEFVDPQRDSGQVERGQVEARVWGNYLELGERQAGEKLEVTYPLPVREEECDHRQSRLQAVPVPGDMEGRHRGPHDARGRTSDDRVFGFRRQTGGSVLRERWSGTALPAGAHAGNVVPKPASLHLDDGSLDFWFLRK